MKKLEWSNRHEIMTVKLKRKEDHSSDEKIHYV